MEQFEIEHFNRATTFHVGDKIRINILVKSTSHASVTFDGTAYSLTFSTARKNKPALCTAYIISSEHLTDSQKGELDRLCK